MRSTWSRQVRFPDRRASSSRPRDARRLTAKPRAPLPTPQRTARPVVAFALDSGTATNDALPSPPHPLLSPFHPVMSTGEALPSTPAPLMPATERGWRRSRRDQSRRCLRKDGTAASRLCWSATHSSILRFRGTCRRPQWGALTGIASDQSGPVLPWPRHE